LKLLVLVIAVISSSSSSSLLKSYAKTTDFLPTRDSSIATTYLNLHFFLFVLPAVVLIFVLCYIFCFFLCIYVFVLYMCSFAGCMIRICAVKPARKQTIIELG